jgi:uncharacterized phage protein gp47/JayE
MDTRANSPRLKTSWVYDVYMGPGTVGIAISMDNNENPMPKPDFCRKQSKRFIETFKPLGG